MSIKKSIYKIKNSSGYDIYHFESDNGMIQVLDGSNNVLGTMKEFAQEGKTISSGKVTDLKTTGLYKIKNVTGLPDEVATDKTSILAITAVGTTNNPDMLNYQLITTSGSIYNKMVVPGSSSTDWSSGGTKLENSINTIISNFGQLSSLNTSAKASMVGAVNEVNTNLKSLKTNYDKTVTDYNNFKSHNHDDRYIKKSGDMISGNLIFSTGTGVIAKNADGTNINVIKQNSGGEFELGNVNTPMNIFGSNIYHNGKKIWTESNDGSGSGLDADKLDGVEASGFAKLSSLNSFSEQQSFDKGIYSDNISINESMSVKSNNGMSISFNNGNSLYISRDLKMSNMKNVELNANRSEAAIQWITEKETFAFLSNPSLAKGELWLWHEGKNAGKVLSINADNFVAFTKSPSISGRKLFLQSSQPDGSIPEGSIWIS